MRRLFSLALGALVLAAQMSCGFDALFEHRLLVAMPTLPDVWEGLRLDAYRIEWRDADGVMRTAIVAPGGEALLCLERGLPQAILAYPLAQGYSLRPAGFLYPADCPEDPDALPSRSPTSASMSFASGYAAEVAGRLAALGLDASAFPLDRLEASWSAKGRDPWALQPWKTARALAEGSFRVSLFPAAGTNVRLPEGRWLPESPFCSLGFMQDGGRDATLPEGLSLFYGEGGRLEVQVDEEGKVIMVLDDP